MAAFQSLRNPIFAQLYAAHAISLLGDSLTWVGLALLAFELGGSDAAVVLGVALTLRVTVFVLLSPVAGALADRLDRKAMMVAADLARVAVVAVIPFVTDVWQIYGLILALNAFTAVFTPTFQATIPQVTGRDEYPKAIALSGATYELLGVLGPAIAGGIAIWLGARSIFLFDAATFLISALLILALPASLRPGARRGATAHHEPSDTWTDVRDGTARLWSDSPLRYSLMLELVASIAGAWILVNTVVLVRGELGHGDLEYGWVMAAFGVGAILGALALAALDRRVPRTVFVLIGTAATSVALLPANFVAVVPLMFLWFVAGAGQNWVNLPIQTLIADRTPEERQGRVYGAHFAWSHLWWAGSYPLAAWLGSSFPDRSFQTGSLIAIGLLLAIHALPGLRRGWRAA